MGTLRAIAIWMLLSAVLWAQPIIENTPLSYTTAGTFVTEVTVTKPAGLEDGDWLVAHFTTDGGGENHSGPAGWTAVFEDIGTFAHTGSVWIKEITDASSEPADYTFTNATGEQLAVCILRVSGTSGIDGSAKSSNEGSFGASATGTGVTTETDNSLVLGFVGKDLNSPEPSLSTGGWSEEVKSGGGGIAYAIASKTQSGAGATGDVEWTIQDGHDWVAFQVALAPASGNGHTVISHLRRWMPLILRRHQN